MNLTKRVGMKIIKEMAKRNERNFNCTFKKKNSSVRIRAKKTKKVYS